MEEPVQVPAPMNMDLLKVEQLHCGVRMEPWHLIQSYRVLGVTGCLKIRYGAGIPKVSLRALPFFSMICVWTGERDIQQRIKEVFKTGQGIS